MKSIGSLTVRCAVVPPPPPPRRRRLARILLNAPRQVDRYFANRPVRRWSWRLLSISFGYLCGNTVTLTFGTLAVNDIVAAVVTVGFYVAVSRWYWGAERPTYYMELANHFKNGVIIALIADAFKLGG